MLDQVIYKWEHSRQVIARALADKYLALAEAGWWTPEDQIRRDIDELFGSAFERFCQGRD